MKLVTYPCLHHSANKREWGGHPSLCETKVPGPQVPDTPTWRPPQSSDLGPSPSPAWRPKAGDLEAGDTAGVSFYHVKEKKTTSQVSLNFLFTRFHMWDRTVLVCLCLTCFTEHDVLKVYPHCWKWQDVLSRDWVRFRCLYVRGFPDDTAVKNLPVRWCRFDPWVRKIPGEGHGNPLQRSSLENPREREAWHAVVHGVAKSQTQLKWLKQQNIFDLQRCVHFRDTAKWLSYTCNHTQASLATQRVKNLPAV